MHCLPGYARAHPNAFGAAFAMDAHENDPKSLRFLPPQMCLASQIQAVPVSAKNIASSDASSLSVAARNSGRIGFIPGPFSHIVLQQVVERFRVRNLPRQKISIRLLTHGWKQCADRRLDIADKTEIQRCTAADMLRVLVNLNLFHTEPREEIRRTENPCPA